MKFQKHAVVLLICWASVHGKAEDSNQLFYPAGTDFDYAKATNIVLNSNLPSVTVLANKLLKAQSIKTAKDAVQINEQIRATAVKAGECYPETQDLAGNWGAPVDGFRLSLRSANNAFTLGDSIPVKVIIRNVTTNTLRVLDMSVNSETRFIFEDETGKIAEMDCELGQNAAASGYGFKEVPPKRQVKYEYDLKNWYNYKPGTYKIRAKQVLFDSGSTNIDSGLLIIKNK